LANPDVFPFSGGRLNLPKHDYIPKDMPLAGGVSVNTTSGNQEMINSLRERYFSTDIESMEGAAFFFVCLKEGIPFVQIRAISNYVEPRDKSKWDIPLAIKNLNDWLIDWLSLNS
jgi:futalosine hydrolase